MSMVTTAATTLFSKFHSEKKAARRKTTADRSNYQRVLSLFHTNLSVVEDAAGAPLGFRVTLEDRLHLDSNHAELPQLLECCDISDIYPFDWDHIIQEAQSRSLRYPTIFFFSSRVGINRPSLDTSRLEMTHMFFLAFLPSPYAEQCSRAKHKHAAHQDESGVDCGMPDGSLCRNYKLLQSKLKSMLDQFEVLEFSDVHSLIRYHKVLKCFNSKWTNSTYDPQPVRSGREDKEEENLYESSENMTSSSPAHRPNGAATHYSYQTPPPSYSPEAAAAAAPQAARPRTLTPEPAVLLDEKQQPMAARHDPQPTRRQSSPPINEQDNQMNIIVNPHDFSPTTIPNGSIKTEPQSKTSSSHQEQPVSDERKSRRSAEKSSRSKNHLQADDRLHQDPRMTNRSRSVPRPPLDHKSAEAQLSSRSEHPRGSHDSSMTQQSAEAPEMTSHHTRVNSDPHTGGDPRMTHDPRLAHQYAISADAAAAYYATHPFFYPETLGFPPRFRFPPREYYYHPRMSHYPPMNGQYPIPFPPIHPLYYGAPPFLYGAPPTHRSRGWDPYNAYHYSNQNQYMYQQHSVPAVRVESVSPVFKDKPFFAQVSDNIYYPKSPSAKFDGTASPSYTREKTPPTVSMYSYV